MTSSSDGAEFLGRRRLFVGGVGARTSNDSIKNFFSRFGPVSLIHNSHKGYAFVTMEEESGANRAIQEAKSGIEFEGRIIKVEYSHSKILPLTGVPRLIKFPRPFGARGGTARRRSSYNQQQGQTSATGSGSLNGTGRGSRIARARGGLNSSSHQARSYNFHHENQNVTSGRHNSKEIQNQSSVSSNHIRVVHCQYKEKTFLPKKHEISDGLKEVLSLDVFPHIAQKIFFMMDAVTLLRCKLVCKNWNKTINQLMHDLEKVRETLMSRWKEAECSLYPVNPTIYEATNTINFIEQNPDSSYRNVLSLKCDEHEILLAVDNGNVEIYDRLSLRLKTVLIGQFSSSPSTVDMNQDIIVVSYTCGFGIGRKYSTTWNVYDRKSKQLVGAIERDEMGGESPVRIGFRNDLLISNNTNFHSFNNYENPDDVCRRKMYSVDDNDKIENWDIDRGHGVLAAIVRHTAEGNKPLMLHVWNQPDEEFFNFCRDEPVDFMTNLKCVFPLLQDFEKEQDSFFMAKCKPLSIELRYPMCLCMLSNAFGFFDHYEDRGSPYTLICVYNVITEECLRTIVIDDVWMKKQNVVPFDYDSAVLSSAFNSDRIVVGFGSYSDRRDGGLAMFDMSEVLDPDISPGDLSVHELPAPSYHWMGWDGHTGGVHRLHLEELQLVAVNACVHQVATRCIEGGDESKKDNVLVYDFWSPGKDFRRKWTDQH